MPDAAVDLAQFHADGFASVRDVISDDETSTLIESLEQLSVGTLASRRQNTYAARNLLSSLPAVRALATSSSARAIVEPVMGTAALAVRGILFDKVPGANWHVGWHQDVVIPVAARQDVPGFTAWSVKQGVVHVRPPAAVLERMLTLRVHLDDCDQSSGALQVIPGSHQYGILSDAELQRLVDEREPVVCEVKGGTALLMRPLLIHASWPAVAASHRRVIHLEFAAEPLSGGLHWPSFH